MLGIQKRTFSLVAQNQKAQAAVHLPTPWFSKMQSRIESEQHQNDKPSRFATVLVGTILQHTHF